MQILCVLLYLIFVAYGERIIGRLFLVQQLLFSTALFSCLGRIPKVYFGMLASQFFLDLCQHYKSIDEDVY